MERSSSVVKFNPLDIEVLVQLMEDGPDWYYAFQDSKKKKNAAWNSLYAELWETDVDITKSRIPLKGKSESTIHSCLLRLKRNDFVEEKKIETKARSKGALHYRLAREKDESRRLIRELFTHLSEEDKSWPRIGYELLRTPWMRWILSPDYIKSELVRRGLHSDEIEYTRTHEALYVILQSTPTGLIRFLREDLWSPSGRFGKSWEEWEESQPFSDDGKREPITDERKREICTNPVESLIHYLTYDIITDLHIARRIGGISPFEIRCEEYHALHHHPLSVLRVAVGALNQNTLSENEVHDLQETTLSAFTIDGSQLAIHAYFDSSSPAILGDPDVYSLEIGGDEGDVYARFRWLERDSWFFKEWQIDHGLD